MKKRLFTTADGRNHVVTFALVSSLFLLWGFCNGMIDVMDRHFQEALHLTLSQSAWVQFAHYLGYFLMALPAGWLATKLGYKGGIIFGLLMVALGGFWFIPATHIASFWAFLLGVCLIASGLTFLETIANPYTTVLGPKEYGATRINLAQSCNGIGWVFGPIVGAQYFYSKNAAGQSTGSETLWIPYAAVGLVVVILAVIFLFSKVPDIKVEDDYHLDDSTSGVSRSIWSHPHFIMAVVSRFFYVAAQAGIFSFFINYMITEPPAIPASWDTAMGNASASVSHFLESIPHWLGWPLPWGPNWLLGWFETNKQGLLSISNKGASNLASVGFIWFLLGRFIGAGLLKKYAAHKVLGIYALLNIVACLLISLKLGWLAVASVFLSYFFMSIMFPTIFALGIHGLGTRAKKASSFIVMAIMGGAVLPKLMGHLADVHGMSCAFVVPMGCFMVVAFYGFSWTRLSKSGAIVGLPSSGSH